jgi:enoyl-CoA hydratase
MIQTHERNVPVTDSVLVEQTDRVLVICINRPQARNAVNRAVTVGIAAAVDELDARDDLSLGIITGAGGTFCSGMDLKAFVRGEDVTLPGRGSRASASDRRPSH